MAKSNLPTAKDRRDMLAEGSGDLGKAGRACLAAGRWGEALECLGAAGDSEGLEDLAREAAAAGDLFYWRLAQEALGRSISPEDLEALADRAAGAGKELFAAKAREMVLPTEAEGS